MSATVLGWRFQQFLTVFVRAVVISGVVGLIGSVQLLATPAADGAEVRLQVAAWFVSVALLTSFFGGAAVAGMCGYLTGTIENSRSAARVLLVVFAGCGVLAVLRYGALSAVVIATFAAIIVGLFLIRRRASQVHCECCGYDISGCATAKCSECGWNPNRGENAMARRRTWLRECVQVLSIISAFLIAMFGVLNQPRGGADSIEPGMTYLDVWAVAGPPDDFWDHQSGVGTFAGSPTWIYRDGWFIFTRAEYYVEFDDGVVAAIDEDIW